MTSTSGVATIPTEEILDMLGAVFFAFRGSRLGRPPLAITYLPYGRFTKAHSSKCKVFRETV